jgi:hypothetical protein
MKDNLKNMQACLKDPLKNDFEVQIWNRYQHSFRLTYTLIGDLNFFFVIVTQILE